MRLGIRTKLIGILVIATVLPLLIGIASLRVLGKNYFVSQKGELYETMGYQVAARLEQTLEERLMTLDIWLRFSDVGEAAQAAVNSQPKLSDEALKSKVAALEKIWPTLKLEDKSLANILNNPLSRRLQRLQKKHPMFAEIFLTDLQGCLIASTNKTSDYWQADEAWWQETANKKPGFVRLEGVHYDDSAEVISLDVTIPVYGQSQQQNKPVGVLKAVIDITPFFSSLPKSLGGADDPSFHIILADGRILVGLFGDEIDPLTASIPKAAMQAIDNRKRSWLSVALSEGVPELVGVSTLDLQKLQLGNSESELTPMMVLVHRDLELVLAPVYTQMYRVMAVGILLVLVFIWMGFLIAQNKILNPLNQLKEASRYMTGRANNKQSKSNISQVAIRRERPLPALIEVLNKIKTGDEIQELAKVFSDMAQRVLNYHEQLEEEVEYRTKEVERDLRMARDFQQAMLPSVYPKIPDPRDADDNGISLVFDHIYKPALSVGGDFFDVFQLDQYTAGIFLADVMGHGARSALITAILRTLIQNIATSQIPPGKTVTLINQRFLEMMPQKTTTMFASAIYLTINTKEQTVRYVSAGHPSPYLISRSRRTVEPFIPIGANGPALGLIQDFMYQDKELAIEGGDKILVFTDGVLEAPNPANEEFGEQRLMETIMRKIDESAPEINAAILHDLRAFMDTVVTPDDICLVTVEAACGVVAANPSP